MKNFHEQLVYITGGSSGIGLAVARELSGRGAHIAIFARNPENLETARRDIEQSRRSAAQRISCLQMDVTDDRDVQDKMSAAVSRFGIPDLLITSAGAGHADNFENISHDAFDALMKVNVYGTRSVVAALVPEMKKKPGGRIVILSSAAGLMGVFGYTSYSTTKFALVGFADCLRTELKPHGIAVTLVCPPEVNTPFLSNESALPLEGRVLKDIAGTLQVEPVARTIVRGIERNRYLVIPGWWTRYLYFNHRLTNGWGTRLVTDLVVTWVRHLR
jgi:3-dehydrosphinganine reductase